MFSSYLKDKYPFLTEYFEQGLKNPSRALAHSILLYGHNISAQYDIATEIARLLNCKEDKSENCQCINCNWAKERQHPAILTISKIDNKPSDDTSKTVISVKQSQMIKNSLLNTSDYHRVFIFCDADIKDGVWTPSGLNRQNFHEATANSLLKSIEEPPENTTFFFLARDKDDLIGTIISRSQSFFVPTLSIDNKEFSTIEDIFTDYLTGEEYFERKNVLDLAQKLSLISKDFDAEKILDEIQNYMLELLKANIENSVLKSKILKDIKAVEKAKKQLSAKILPQLVFDEMCLNLS